MPSPPVSLRCVSPAGARSPRIVVGCDDGTVAALDEKGALVQLGRITGRPTHAVVLDNASRPLAVLATDKGDVKGFNVGD